MQIKLAESALSRLLFQLCTFKNPQVDIGVIKNEHNTTNLNKALFKKIQIYIPELIIAKTISYL